MIKIALSSLLCTALATASTTMCFKKDHMDPSNIETTPLDGGECKGKLSVQNMKTGGYEIKDIKITVGDNGMNYMYIFSKQSVIVGDSNTKAPLGTQILTKEQLKSYLNELKEEDMEEEKRKELLGNIALGKEMYVAKCASCHGEKAELRAYGSSRALNTLTFEDMDEAIEEFDFDKRKGINALVMKPYASLLTHEKLKNVAAYIKTLK